MDGLKTIRPKLKVVAPLTHAICLGYAMVNAIIGLGFIILISRGELRSPLLLVNRVLTFEVWGMIFLLLSGIMAYALAVNNWQALRKSLILGLLVKFAWLIMLIHRTIDNPSTILWTAVWLFFAYIQAITYIHFMPNLTPANDDRTSL